MQVAQQALEEGYTATTPFDFFLLHMAQIDSQGHTLGVSAAQVPSRPRAMCFGGCTRTNAM